MQTTQNYNRSLHYFAVFTAISTFILIFAGGLVTSTGSGLSVPDWPLSFGQVMPPMVGGVVYEHSHRLIASFVGMLTVILAIWLWKKDNRKWLKILGFYSLGAVIVQGVLGGLTVLFLLPTPISVAHATLAQTFFCAVSSIALFTSRWWLTSTEIPSTEKNTSKIFWLPIITTGMIFLQLIFGALMRHTHSGLAVPDFPLAYGQLFPSLSEESLAKYNLHLIAERVREVGDGHITPSQIVIHMLHRIWGFVVTIMIITTSIVLLKHSALSSRIKILAEILLGLIIIQFTLGALTVLTEKSVIITTAHVAIGAVTLATSLLTVLHLVKLLKMNIVRKK